MEFLSRCNNQEKYDGLRRPTATGPYFQGALHFADNADEETEYAYDANGNTVADLNRGVLSATYDFNGMPRAITFADGSANAYVYDATGRTRRTVHRVASAPPSVPGAEPSGFVTMTADYCGDILYEDSTLTRIDFEGGYISFSDDRGNALARPEYHFYVCDHLGNNRMDLTDGGAITQIVDYYPFGLPMGCSYRPAAQRRLFGGKELDRTAGLNLYDQEARLYDAATGRFTRPDPLSEKKTMLSHYLYCGANPLTRIDPSGLDDYILDEHGYLVKHIENKDRDQISIIDENMNPKEGAIIEFKYGTFDMSNLSRNRSDSDDKVSGGSKEDDYSYLTCTNAADSEKFHSFLSKNTKVEWVNAEIEMEDHSKERYMTTSHKESTEKGFRKLWNKLVDNELKPRRLVRHDHNHPSGVAIPSGLDDRERHDIGNATEFTNMSPKEPPVFRLLDWKNDKYVHYDVNSKLEDFIPSTFK